MNSVPTTDEEVYEVLRRCSLDELLFKILSDLYDVRREMGESVFDAYTETIVDLSEKPFEK